MMVQGHIMIGAAVYIAAKRYFYGDSWYMAPGVVIAYLLSIGWFWLSLLCPLLGGLLVGCCWSSVVDWWAVVGQPP